MGFGKFTFKRALTVVAILCSLATPGLAGECAPGEVHLRGDWGQARFSVEVAATQQDRNTGLMHRDSLPRTAGMLFVYDKPGSRAFWMKNTRIPLDILYLDATGTIARVHSMAKPHDETPIFGGHNIQYVLEINGGMAELLGITEGSQLRHSAIDTSVAAWPC